MFANREWAGPGLYLILLGTLAGWISLNFFGLFQNRKMREELSKILDADRVLPADRLFVGFTTPKYTGLLDAHEDVGFLCFSAETLRFVSETRTVDVEKGNVKRVVFRPNVHSVLGLGRWVCVEGERKGTEIRMLLEPRERPTMLGNLRYGRRMRDKIESWRVDTTLP
jgi:hypothetical protein